MEQTQRLTQRYQEDAARISALLRVDQNFDLIARPFLTGGRHATLFFVDGFIKDDIMEKILQFLLKLTSDDMEAAPDAAAFHEAFLSYVETQLTRETDSIVIQVLSGTLALLVEGYEQAFLIDARTYPSRGVEEPEDDRVLRGSRDGFVETLIQNTALLRRRFRDPALTMDILSVGDRSHTDVVLCYLENQVDHRFLASLKEKIQGIAVHTLTMSQESLAECLIRKQWFNPFPRIRYTERPDAASACVAEGKVVVLIDNSPAAMLLPVTIFDFLQDTNDYYFPPLIGTYLRNVRVLVFLLTVFLTPVWYLLIRNPAIIPPWLSFIQVEESNQVPVIAQLLLIELVIDGLKLASLNTPSALGNSFSVIAALVLGDFAVKARWFVPEVVLYMAFVAVSNFTQPSYELAYAFKLFRVLILVLTALFNYWGFGAGVVLLCLLLGFTRTVSGKSYLHPLIPFHGKALLELFVRHPISKRNT